MKVRDRFISASSSRVIDWASDWIGLIDVGGIIGCWYERVDKVGEPSEKAGVFVVTGPEFSDSSASR